MRILFKGIRQIELSACLIKTCLFDKNLKSNLPIDYLKGCSKLTAQR